MARAPVVRPDGRPHIVPVDGLWLDDSCFFGGSAQTVKRRNLTSNPQAVVHLEDATSAVIVEELAKSCFRTVSWPPVLPKRLLS